MPGQPQEGRALVRVALDDLRDVGRDGLVVDVGGARGGGRDGRDDGGDGAAEDGAAFQRCRGFVGLRRRVCAARRVNFCPAPAAACKRLCKPRWSTCRFGACSAIAALLAKAIKAACLSIVWLNLVLLLAAEASLDWQKLEL